MKSPESPASGIAEDPQTPVVESNDWHDQIKSATKLLALAMDRLGLEERHNNLAWASPLYKKVSLAVFPPIRASFHYIHGQTDHGDLNPSLNRDIHEEEDVAFPVNEHHGPSSLLSMLATALAYAGSTSLKAIGSILHDNYKDENGIELQDGNDNSKKNRNGEQIDPESLSSQFIDEEDPIIHGPLTRTSSGKGSARRTSTTGLGEDTFIAPSTIRKQSTITSIEGSNSTDLRRMYSTEIMARALTNDNYQPPPENLRSTWENSVMSNHHIRSVGDKVLIRYETGHTDETEESPEKCDILKYHIALKLKETFDFDDENYLFDHFDVWLIKDVLLQGHLYITRDAVCFYSLLPGKFTKTELNDPELTLHAGALGHKLAHYGDSFFSSVYTNRFWAVLKPHTLSIYTSPTKLYFPVRTIDLRNAISCEICDSGVTGVNITNPSNSPNMSLTPTEPSISQVNSEISSIAEEDVQDENIQSGVWFKINCTDKAYRFHTSSIFSARHWYNSISKAIFLLQNTNPQREVILRLPVEDIVDYKKNHFLTEAETVEPPVDQDEDAPIAFSLKFNLPPNHEHSKSLRQKTKKKENLNIFHDSAHFVVFQKGAELSSTFEKALEANIIESDSRSQRQRRRNKHFFREDRNHSISLGSKGLDRVVTTVQPESTSSQSIIDKIMEVNEKLIQAREKDLSKGDGQTNNFSDTTQDSDLKRFSYVPNFKLMKEKFLPKALSNTSSASITNALPEIMRREEDSLLPPPDFDIPDFDQNLQLPRPFSLLMLKNLDIQMVRKRRSFEDIASQYGNLLEILREKRAKEHASRKNDITIDNENSQAETIQESQKQGKLKSLKHLLRTVSTIGGVWSARPEHYESILNHDEYVVHNVHDKIKALNHFRNHFSLGSDSHLVSAYYAHLKRTVPVYGRVYVGKDQLCFRSIIPGVSTKMVLPLRDIQSCKKQTRLYHYAGLVVRIRGLEDLQFAFGSKEARNDCQKVILKILRKEETIDPDIEFNEDNKLTSSIEIDESEDQTRKTDEVASSRVHVARLRLLEDKISSATGIDMPLLLEDNPFTTTEVKLSKCLKITLLTIGSRGDVQPYIALGKGLLKEGHEVTIATHEEFKDWILKHGINFKEIAGNPAELMLLMVTHGSMSVGFLKEASTKFRGWIGELLESSWKACQGAELLIESPSAMAGLHIAEALNIPYMRAFTMPWTRTKAYPHAFLVPDQNRGGSYNFLTHVMFENVFWKGISGQVNRWRVETLGLNRTSLVKMQQSRVPFLYNVSPAMFPPSVDFPDWVKVTGYWFLDEGSDEYEPPKKLVKFLEEAKAKGDKVVYIGFGSIVVSDAKALTKTIVEAVLDLGVKCILNKGWSDKLSKSKNDIEVELPPQIYDSGMIPHDWLFTKIDAAVHHGGSGTTGATLRAGLPTIIKPFFGDQFFFASRVEDLGVGLSLKHLNKKSFTKALKSITSDEKFLTKASEVAKAMSRERGVLSAIEAIYTELAYSKSLILTIHNQTQQKKPLEDKSGGQTPIIDEDAFEVMGDTSEEDFGVISEDYKERSRND